MLVLPDLPHLGGDDTDAEGCGPLVQSRVEFGAADARARAAPEGRFRAAQAVRVPDAAQFAAAHPDAEVAQGSDAAGHDALAARLVDGGGARLDHHRFQARGGGPDGGGEPGRSAARDQDVDHARASTAGRRASAPSSQRIRTAMSAALRTVNTRAVTHAPWTRGSASPSAATAT